MEKQIENAIEWGIKKGMTKEEMMDNPLDLLKRFIKAQETAFNKFLSLTQEERMKHTNPMSERYHKTSNR